MKFTKETPKNPGFYWVKRVNLIRGSFLTIAEVFKSNPLLKEPDSICYCGNTYTINDDRFLEFCGPIPNPTE